MYRHLGMNSNKGSYSPTTRMPSSKSQIQLYTKIAAGVLQIAIITIMILDGIEVRDINRFKYYAGEPYNMPITKDYYLNRRLVDMNTRLGLLITVIVLVCIKQPVFWYGVAQDHFISLITSSAADLICFVIYVVHLAAFHRESNFDAEAAVGLVFSFLSSAITAILAVRVRQDYEYD